jgi:hypothetical protein
MQPVEPGHYAIHATSGDGFYWGTPNRYEIGFYDRAGALRRILRRTVTPAPVTQPMIDAWIEVQVQDRVRYEGPAAEDKYRQLYASMTFGQQAPLFDRAFVDGDSRLWVGQASWPERRSATRMWSVFGPDGAWLADVESPPDVQLLDIRGGLVLAVWQPSGEAPSIQVHRLSLP